ncbi:carbohydrate ABC transporter permease [Catellatospora coxensis]
MTQVATTQPPQAEPAVPIERAGPARRGRHRYARAVTVFVAPFAVLFLLFYVVPIVYAVVQSLYVVQRTGTYGPAQEVFGGLAQYRLVFSDGPFWASVGRMLAFGAVQVPIMLGIALALALLLDSGLVTGRRFFRLAFFVPYAVPGVVAAIMWGSCTPRTCRHSNRSPAPSTCCRPTPCCGPSPTSSPGSTSATTC